MSQVLTPLAYDTLLQSGESVGVQFSATLITVIANPTDSALLSACSSDSRFTPDSFSNSFSSEVDPLGYGGTIYFTITDAGQGMLVSDMVASVKNQINSFYSLMGVSIDEIDSISTSFAPSLTTTISLVAIALIILAVVAVYFSLRTKRAIGI